MAILPARSGVPKDTEPLVPYALASGHNAGRAVKLIGSGS
jgi:hypothetical protein